MIPLPDLQCICIAVILKLTIAEEYSIKRNDPRLPIHGTKNWKFVGGSKFSPRHSHATCIFKCPDNSNESCIWLTGGYSESHRTFDVEFMENESSDVWWSRNGADWNQVTKLYGDFLQGIGNGDALDGGYVAPWYSRYGHSFHALDGDGDRISDVMVLAGGFSPLPSNDVWISQDGITWRFDGFAPWPKRAYHGAAIFQGKLWIMGGSPLSNDAWVGTLVEDTSRDVGYKLLWEQVLSPNEAPWTPRAGFCAITQHRQYPLPEPSDTNFNLTEASYNEILFIIGGLAVSGDVPSDGTRTRNDVWKTIDGVAWEKVSPSSGQTMPWGGRAFHGCVTWHSLQDRTRWVGYDFENVKLADDRGVGNKTVPRMFITGGGYMGSKGNNHVRELEAYTDTWWSHDGADWARINYEEGSKHDDNLYSTQEWTETNVEGRTLYRGKWGHSVESFFLQKSEEDSDQQSEIAYSIDACSSSKKQTAACKTLLESTTPTLLVIGGKLDSMMMVNDVFVSKPGVHCETDGITCNGNGICGPGTQGCSLPQ